MLTRCCQDDLSKFRDDPVDRHVKSDPATRVGRNFISTARAIARLYRTWTSRSRERGQLARMSDRELQDIRITRYDATFEANKPFWKP